MDAILQKLDSVLPEIREAGQDRTRFQLEKFVVGAPQTPERRYLQVLTELRAAGMSYQYLQCSLQEKKSQLAKLALDIQEIELQISDKAREIEKLSSIHEKMPKFTRPEMEEAEQRFYQARLNDLANQAQFARAVGVDVGTVAAMCQAGTLTLSVSPDGKLVSKTVEQPKQLPEKPQQPTLS